MNLTWIILPTALMAAIILALYVREISISEDLRKRLRKIEEQSKLPDSSNYQPEGAWPMLKRQLHRLRGRRAQKPSQPNWGP